MISSTTHDHEDRPIFVRRRNDPKDGILLTVEVVLRTSSGNDERVSSRNDTCERGENDGAGGELELTSHLFECQRIGRTDESNRIGSVIRPPNTNWSSEDRRLKRDQLECTDRGRGDGGRKGGLTFTTLIHRSALRIEIEVEIRVGGSSSTGVVPSCSHGHNVGDSSSLQRRKASAKREDGELARSLPLFPSSLLLDAS